MRQAVILVGGRGTRLGEAARQTPKPLMPIAGEMVFLDYLIANMARHGLDEILLLAGHLGEQVEARYQGAKVLGAKLAVIREPYPAGTAGALNFVAERLAPTFLMSNGDSLFDMNYLALAGAMRPGDVGALALRPVADAARYGRVSLQGDRIAAFHEKDPSWRGSALISGGVYLLRRDILDFVTELPCSIETCVFPKLAQAQRLAGLMADGYFIDIGLPETLAEARSEMPARLRRPAVFFDRDGTLNADAGYTHRCEELTFLPGAIDAVKACNDAGALAVVVTNQAGIAHGYYGEEHMHAFHARMQDRLREAGAHIDAFYYCPFHKDGSVAELARADHPDRKPAPGMLRRAMLEWPIDIAGTFMVGDQDHDVAAAVAAGVRGYKVAPGQLLQVVTDGLAMLQDEAPRRARVDYKAALKSRAAEARAWLFDSALPLWWEVGFDRASNSFHERLTLDARPVPMPRRVRVQARQTFVYASAGRLGWPGPWQDAVKAGASALIERGLSREGGTIHLWDDNGQPLDLRRDLYDIAFVIFALAHAGAVLARNDFIAAASDLADWTFANWMHPLGGLVEGEVVASPPRRQNPHMHLLEALLALYECSGDKRHLQTARQIVDLFSNHFFDHRWGALLEYFDDGWRPQAGERGRITEPGHQFEWAWLLDRYRRFAGAACTAADRIYMHGEIYGVDANGFVADEVWVEGGVRLSSSRLWPHTERIKANIIRVERSRDAAAAANTISACDALRSYFDTPVAGLWRDRRQPDGSFADEAALASSFYHIITAYSELIRVTDSL